MKFRERVWGLGWTETAGVKTFGAPPLAVFLRAPTKVAPRSVQGGVSAGFCVLKGPGVRGAVVRWRLPAPP